MKSIITILAGLFITAIQAQKLDTKFDSYVVVTATTLSIRELPDINSKKIGSANFGEWVKAIDLRKDDNNLVEVNGVFGIWSKIEHEGIQGYMFGAYLDYNTVIQKPNSNWDEDYLLLFERRLRGAKYSDNLKWYGIYSEEDGEYIYEIDLSLEYTAETEHPELELENHIIVKTDRTQKAQLLIGTNQTVRTGKVGVSIPHYYKRHLHNDINLPIPFPEADCLFNTDYYINGTNHKHNETDYCFLENYKVTLRKNHPTRNVTICEFENAAEVLRECNLPEFYWYGDINNDHIPDLIFKSSGMYYSKYKVYLSKVIDGKIQYRKPIEHIPFFDPC